MENQVHISSILSWNLIEGYFVFLCILQPLLLWDNPFFFQIWLISHQHDDYLTFTVLLWNKLLNTYLFVPVFQIGVRFLACDVISKENSRCSFIKCFHDRSETLFTKYLYCYWPTVSHIWSRITFPLISTFFAAYSTPIVVWWVSLNWLRVNLRSKLDLPTPEEPIRMTLNM